MAILFKRNESKSEPAPVDTQAPLLIALVTLLSLGIFLTGALYFIRRLKSKRAELAGNNSKNPRQLTIKTGPFPDNRRSYSEKEGLMYNSPGSPDSIPEIRITFPEEEDSHGRKKSGRVVIVEVGEAGVGFVRPVPDENLPPYQQHDGFSAVDIEKIGGLKEKSGKQWV